MKYDWDEIKDSNNNGKAFFEKKKKLGTSSDKFQDLPAFSIQFINYTDVGFFRYILNIKKNLKLITHWNHTK